MYIGDLERSIKYCMILKVHYNLSQVSLVTKPTSDTGTEEHSRPHPIACLVATSKESSSGWAAHRTGGVELSEEEALGSHLV